MGVDFLAVRCVAAASALTEELRKTAARIVFPKLVARVGKSGLEKDKLKRSEGDMERCSMV